MELGGGQKEKPKQFRRPRGFHVNDSRAGCLVGRQGCQGIEKVQREVVRNVTALTPSDQDANTVPW